MNNPLRLIVILHQITNSNFNLNKMKQLLNQLLLILIISCFNIFNTYSQHYEVLGKIVDSDGEDAIGATVLVKGTDIGTVTDINGNYKISVPDIANNVLIFSYVGMKTIEVNVQGRKVINITLEPSSVMLNEVVAIGYGSTRRKDLTGAISSVSADKINKVPVTNVTQALAGKVAGMVVTQSDGSPDANVAIRIRGGLSITQDNEPLYIIDGFPSEDGFMGLDPSDIESIEVLKDASATAIYGARGGNGVVLVTTKKGKEGKATVSYDMYYGMKKLTNKMALLSIEDFVRLEYERAMLGGATEITKFAEIYGDGFQGNASNVDNLYQNMYNIHNIIHDVYATRSGIDWQGLIFDDANPKSQNHKLSISGGSKDTKYLLSYAFSDDQGIMAKSGLTRHNFRLNLDQRLSRKMRVRANVSYIEDVTEGLGSLGEKSYFSRMQHIIQYRPTIGKNRDDQELVKYQNDPISDDDSGNQMQNPIVSIENEERTRFNKILQINGNLTYEIIKGLTYRGNFGYRKRDYKEDQFYQFASRQAINNGAPWGRRILRNYYSRTYNNTLTYRLKMPKHHRMEIMLGQEVNERGTEYMSVEAKKFPKENFGMKDMSLAETMDKARTDLYGEKLISFFTRVNYNHKDKYLATVTMRTDGSSKFGTHNKWGYFPSASFAWRVNEEGFLKDVETISNLKLRLSYGTTGNNRIPVFKSISKMTSSWMPFENKPNPAYYSSQLPNPDLKWETNISSNIGLDIGILDQRIQFVVEAYRNETSDLLLESRVPLYSGYATKMRNIGKTRNTGLELTLTTVNIEKRDFFWETSFNISTNKNKVIALTDVDHFTTRSRWAGDSFPEDDYIVRIGDKLGSMYGYKWIGLYTVNDFNYDPATKKYTLKEGIPYDPDNYPKPGFDKFENTDDSDKLITSKDKQIIGNASPSFYGGLTNTFNYKQFDFSFAFNFSIGNDVYNANKMYFTKMSNRYRNSLDMVANRFTYIDETGANVFREPKKLSEINAGKTHTSVEGSTNLKFSSKCVEDGSYLRLNNVTLGYTLPRDVTRKINISNLRFYFSGYNLLLLTKYSGFDPEVNARPNGGLTPGVDWGAYPRSMNFVVGANVSF